MKEPLLTRDVQRKADLLPCPFCGSKDAIPVDLSLDDPWYVIQCGRLGKNGCGASVGSTISYAIARRHWNDRVLLTSSASQTATVTGVSSQSEQRGDHLQKVIATGARENEKPCPWIRTAGRPPTEPDTDGHKHVLFLDRLGFADVMHYRFADHPEVWPFWMPIPPVPEGQAPVDTAVQTKTSLGVNATKDKNLEES